MEPWAIEEAILRPAATLAVCGLLPVLAEELLRRVLGGGAGLRVARRIVVVTEIVLASLAGATALGPALIPRPGGWESTLFAALSAGIAFAAGHLASRRPARDAEPRVGAGILVGAVTAVMLIALTVAPWTLTAIAPDGAAGASESAARWRLRVDPWDPVAMLASGWAARRRETYSRALEWAAEARAQGASEALTLELEAEIYAARGQCDEARAHFDRALRARAEAAFADPLAGPLELGYHLPPSLVTECPRATSP